MRRRILYAALAAGLALAMVSPTVALAQARHGGPGHGGGPHVVVRGYYGYPYYSPYWGFYPWYGYGYWGWSPWYYGGWGYDPTGSVRLQVTPKQAQVFVDGYFVGIVEDFDGTFQRLHVPPGGHELVLYLEGYRTVRQSFYATTGRDFKVAYAMVALGPGERSEPPPAPVNPPEDQQTYPPGRRVVPQQRAPLPPRGAEPPPIAEPPVNPPPAARDEARGFGTLAIRVQPSGAEILVDGERWRGPEGEERLLIAVAEGSHTVEIRKAGYVTFSTDIQVRRGDTEALNVSLPPRDRQ